MENEFDAPLDFRPTRDSSALKDFGDSVPDHLVATQKPQKLDESGTRLDAPLDFRLERKIHSRGSES